MFSHADLTASVGNSVFGEKTKDIALFLPSLIVLNNIKAAMLGFFNILGLSTVFDLNSCTKGNFF